jgi:hypothetical protein
MQRILSVILFCLFITKLQAQTLQSPEEFLGYKVGSKFTFHHRVVDYVRYVAAQRPQQVKIVDYGTTNEGRPLLIAIVASPENMAKIEEIRTNNLKNIGLIDGKATAKVPAIAWLSYNVHGNESVSTNTVSSVLYELLNPNNAAMQGVLKNTVVILDPCINPDGYERYTQWYNRVANYLPNANPAAIEHNEPWPGGRFNHYLFDLNRDWAWQTQKETEQRLKVYNSWMPHLHADFHEMGVNNPYYFPPSAKPYHENLTSWQREFQQVIGDFNKKYFDKNYWLYFTHEQYDLLYPSYGDTYPSYNGAIGMTYEQGGSGRAGLAIAKEDGDTLTLRNRIDHHFAASMATLEAISSRAEKTVDEFAKFFDKSNPIGTYKTYVLKTKGDEAKVRALTKQLDKLQINYGFAERDASSSGFSYQSLKDESFKIEANDLIISAYQPKGTFAKILFEPKTVVEDSNTYDITTWSLPYAYGLKAFATKDKFQGVSTKLVEQTIKLETLNQKPYAYIASWKTMEDVRFLAAILAKKIKVRTNEVAFETEGRKFDVGSLIITRTNNERMGDSFDKIIQEEAKRLNISILPVMSGMVKSGNDFGSSSVNLLENPRVAAVLGEGISPTAIGEVWHFFEQQINYPITMLDANSFGRVQLDQFDVLVLADGSYDRILNADALKKWVQAGGKVIAMESATNYFADKEGWGLKRKKDNEKKDELRVYGNREREAIMDQIPGAIYKVQVDNTHPLAYGYDGSYHALVRDAYNYEYLKDGWNVGYVKDNAYITGFGGKNAKEKMKNTLIFGVHQMGRGSVVYLTDNPLFRGFWYNGKLLFGNALFMVN